MATVNVGDESWECCTCGLCASALKEKAAQEYTARIKEKAAAQAFTEKGEWRYGGPDCQCRDCVATKKIKSAQEFADNLMKEKAKKESPPSGVLLNTASGTNTTTISTASAATRKALPLCTGVLDYFPNALLAVAQVSKAGNDQHNPGEPLHWSRDKSTDHADCALRHFVDRGKRDTDGGRHTAKAAWRILAELELEIEADGEL